MELEVAPGVMKTPSWALCITYEQKVREATMGPDLDARTATGISPGTREE